MTLRLPAAGTLMALWALTGPANGENYGPFPVTVPGYAGSETTSVAYAGQTARHALQNSLKKLAGRGTTGRNDELKAQMTAYYSGKEGGRGVIDPATNGEFKIKQSSIDELSKGKNLKGKTFGGLVPGFPGNKTGPEVVEYLIDKASSADQGFDPLTGYDYPQLISKFLMGAVFYNQAVDNYLDELLEADVKPNDKAYQEGKHYTGKEHVWDEAFGYFGAPVHAMSLSAADAYGIAKRKGLEVADANGDGVVDLLTEMTFGHAYYAADADKSGSSYMHTITKAFIDGRKLISSANGAALTDADRAKLKSYAAVIKKNWEKVIAEATFKYAGATYKDLQTLQAIIKSNGDASKAFRAYGKHWGELKGFALALQTSGKDLGETAVRLNRLIGFGPVLLGGGQVTGLDARGNLQTGGDKTLGEYMVHMIKVQALLADRFDLRVKKNDVTREMRELVKTLGSAKSAEND